MLSKFRPTKFVDLIISWCFQRKHFRLAEAFSYYLKGDHLTARISLKDSGNNTLYLSPLSYIDRLLLGKVAHDPEVRECLLGLYQKDDVFWDVGANIGSISLALHDAFPEADIYCFEPSPWISQQLLAHSATNYCGFKIFSLALSDREAVLPLLVKLTGNLGQSGFSVNSRTSYDDTVHVAAVTGDSLVANGLAKPPTILKLDVEGHELNVLKGLSSQISSGNIRAIIYENCEIFSKAEDLQYFLEKRGFSLKRLGTNSDNWLAIR